MSKAFQAVGLSVALLGVVGLGIGLAWSQPSPSQKKVVSGSPGVEQFIPPQIQQPIPPDKHTLYLVQSPTGNLWSYRTDIYEAHPPYESTPFAFTGMRAVIVPYNGGYLKDVPQAEINAFVLLAYPVPRPPPPFESPFDPNSYAKSLGL